MKAFKFKTTLKRPEGIGTWHYVDTPIQVEKEFGTKAKVRINGKINGIAFNATLIPRGKGEHYIVLDKNIREKVGIEVGNEIMMEVWKDNSERIVTVPDDFKKNLSVNKISDINFRALAYSHKKAYVDWINGAKKEETRKNRIFKAIAMLAENKKLK